MRQERVEETELPPIQLLVPRPLAWDLLLQPVQATGGVCSG